MRRKKTRGLAEPQSAEYWYQQYEFKGSHSAVCLNPHWSLQRSGWILIGSLWRVQQTALHTKQAQNKWQDKPPLFFLFRCRWYHKGVFVRSVAAIGTSQACSAHAKIRAESILNRKLHVSSHYNGVLSCKKKPRKKTTLLLLFAFIRQWINEHITTIAWLRD